jgi:glycosyltransferase involved in cell wall biosynthesis
MKRVFFLNRYFFPDHSASSQILSQLAFHLAESGRNIHVITSQQIYDNPGARLAAQEVLRGVTIHRISGTQFGRSALLGRGIDYLSFYAAARRLLIAMAGQGDILVPMTDPPLLSIVGMHAARRRRAHLVNWLQDIYPEVAIELGVPFIKGPVSTILSYLRDASLKAADANVVVGERMAEKVRTLGVASDRIHVIPNWCDDKQITPVAAGDNPLRKKWKLEDKFVVGYSGNLGRAHEFDTLLAAAERLKNNPRIVFLFIGSGHRTDELARRVKACGLSHVFRFLPYQDNDVLKYSLSVSDVHWISLRPELEGLIVPSKFYGIAAAGRPIIAITARDGEIARLVQQHKCGLIIEPGQADALAAALAQLSTDTHSLVAMGVHARTMLDAHFTRRQSLDRWRNVLDRVEQS